MLNRDLCKLFNTDPVQAQLVDRQETYEELLKQYNDGLLPLSDETVLMFKAYVFAYNDCRNIVGKSKVVK